MVLFELNRQQLANIPPINRRFPSPSEVVFFLIRPHFLAVINGSRLSRWPSALNTYSTVAALFRLGTRERRELYCVKGQPLAPAEEEELETIGWREGENRFF